MHYDIMLIRQFVQTKSIGFSSSANLKLVLLLCFLKEEAEEGSRAS